MDFQNEEQTYFWLAPDRATIALKPFSGLAGGLVDGKEVPLFMTGREGERRALAIFTSSENLWLGAGLLLQKECELNWLGGLAPAS